MLFEDARLSFRVLRFPAHSLWTSPIRWWIVCRHNCTPISELRLQLLNMGKTTFTLAGREWPKITWWRTKYMRSLYLFLWAAMLTSATNGKTVNDIGC